MHPLLKSLYIQRVSALYVCHLQGCHKLYLHHYLNHKLSQLIRCYVTFIYIYIYIYNDNGVHLSISVMSRLYIYIYIYIYNDNGVHLSISDITASEL
jgi:hypothetical protein